MKRFVFALTSLLAAGLLSVSVYASQIEISKAEQSEENGDVTVVCSITTDYVSQAVTVYAAEYLGGTYDKESPIYINQYVPSVNNGEFTFSFKYMAGIDTDNKAYIVRVGGYDVSTPAERIIVFYDGKTYSAGDINGDGNITGADAALVMRYISGLGGLNGSQLEAADVISEGGSIVDIDMLDVIEILNRKTS